jgi:trans-aconitate methyltransferase
MIITDKTSLEVAITNIDFPMSRERYLSTWKIFRAISDENFITANHLLSLDSWDNIQSVLDLGCGDGLISKSLVLNSPQQINKVILVDPDGEMVNEAEMHLSEIGIVDDVEKHLSGFETCFDVCVLKVDVVLAVHLVYLITTEAFQRLIDRLPVGKKLILVLDDESSIFTKLWKRTATKYAQRSEYVRNYLDNLHNEYSVKKTVITSKLVNPLVQRTDVKDALLSLMSYSDYLLMDNNSKMFVENCVKDNLSGRFVECRSACYEIVKVR